MILTSCAGKALRQHNKSEVRSQTVNIVAIISDKNTTFKKVSRKVQEEPQAEAAANPRHQEDEKEKVTQTNECIANKQKTFNREFIKQKGKKVVPKSQNPKVVFSLFETLKL